MAAKKLQSIPSFEIPNKDLIDKILNQSNTGVLAGGYLRDLFYGKPYKDMDFFFSVEKENFSFLIEEAIPEILNFNSEKDEINPHMKYIGNTALSFSIIKEGKMKYDFIFISGAVEQHIKNWFDLSLNQIWYSPTKDIGYYPGFVKTFETKKVTMIKGDLIQPDRLKRMQEKFPEFTFPKSVKQASRSVFDWSTATSNINNVINNNIIMEVPPPPNVAQG